MVVQNNTGALLSRKERLIGPVVLPKASDILATQIRNHILAGRFAVGDLLPPERELVAESGLSRASVREALRVLESEGLISTRPGRNGGSMVTLPGRASVARSLELFVRSHGVRLESLLECRVGVEPFLAGLAAQRRSERDLREMKDIHQQFILSVDDIASYKRINVEWHLAVARASANEPLIALMEAIAQPILDAADYQQVTTDELRPATVKAHEKILQAIASQDPGAAFTRMERHLSAYRDIMRSMLPSGATE